jgi:glutamate synthase (NADPH/NADH) small chain
MPGSQREVTHAIEEGVKFEFNIQPLGIEVMEQGERATGVRVVKTQLGAPDGSGRRRPEPMPESERSIEADAVILAFGFRPSPPAWFEPFGIEVDQAGKVICPPGSYSFQTTREKIFAAGDMVRGADLVVTAIADAREAAEGIIRYLNETS